MLMLGFELVSGFRLFFFSFSILLGAFELFRDLFDRCCNQSDCIPLFLHSRSLCFDFENSQFRHYSAANRVSPRSQPSQRYLERVDWVSRN